MAKGRKASKTYWVSLSELVTLLANLHIAAKDPDIGYAATEPLKQVNRRMSKQVNWFPIKKRHLENCLWACNMLNEKDSFWQPWIKQNRIKFADFIEQIVGPDYYYDKFNSYIKRRKKRKTRGKQQSNP